MSFHIHAAGRVADAVEQVKNIQWVPENPQAERTRDFVLAQLEAWPVHANSPKGVLVEASGHQDSFSQNLTLTIRPLYIQEPRQEAEGDA